MDEKLFDFLLDDNDDDHGFDGGERGGKRIKLFVEGEEGGGGILPPLFDPTVVSMEETTMMPKMMTMMKMKEEEEEEKINVMPSAEEMEMKIRRGRDVFTAVGCGRTNIYEASINQQIAAGLTTSECCLPGCRIRSL